MMENFKIPKKDKKVKMLTVPVTQSEHKEIMQYCRDQNVTLTTLIRYALSETYNIKMI